MCEEYTKIMSANFIKYNNDLSIEYNHPQVHLLALTKLEFYI